MSSWAPFFSCEGLKAEICVRKHSATIPSRGQHRLFLVWFLGEKRKKKPKTVELEFEYIVLWPSLKKKEKLSAPWLRKGLLFCYEQLCHVKTCLFFCISFHLPGSMGHFCVCLFHPNAAVWPWESYLTSLWLGVLLSDMRVEIIIQQNCGKNYETSSIGTWVQECSQHTLAFLAILLLFHPTPPHRPEAQHVYLNASLMRLICNWRLLKVS